MKQEKPPRNPATRIVVLLTACLVTAIGIVVGLEPDVILVRCLIACVLTGLSTHVVVTLLQTVIDPDHRNSSGSNQRSSN